MISNYERPQATIAQVLEDTENSTLDRLHAVVVGPAFVHADAAADNLVWVAYDPSATLPYLRKVGGASTALTTETLDEDSVSVLARNLRLTLFSKGSVTDTPTTTQFRTYTEATGDLLLYGAAGGIHDTGNVAIVNAFDLGRPPTPGDIYRITSDLATVERKVTGLVGRDLTSSVGATAYAGALPWLDSAESSLIEVSFSNFTQASAAAITSLGTAAELYAHQQGLVAPVTVGGLRLSFDVTCTQSGDRSTSAFSAVVNGVAVAIANIAHATSGKTTFTTLTDLVFVIDRGTGNNAWTVGERYTAVVDVESVGDADVLSGNVDASGYDYLASSRRIQSTLIVEVIAVASGSSTLRISDSAGLMTPLTEVVTGAATVELSYDGGVLSVDIPADLVYSGAARPHTGQRYTILVNPPSRSTTVFDKVRLSAPIGMEGADPGFAVTAYVPFTGAIPAVEPVLGTINYAVEADGVEPETFEVQVDGYPLPANSVKVAASGYGEVAVVFRAVKLAGSTEGLIPIESEADIVAYVGSSALESELGYGALKALNGSQGKRVYVLNTGAVDSDDEAWTAALKKLEASNITYATALLTSREAPMQALANHNRRLSAKEVKRFRRGYVGTDSPGEYPILNVRTDLTTYSAAISLGTNSLYNLVTFSDENGDLDLELLTITRGDKLVISADGTAYEIESVTGPTTLVLKVGPALAVAATPVTIVAADTPENTARYVYSRSERLGANAEEDRRIANVWTDNGVIDIQDGSPRVIPNRFGACEAAGLRTALQPQQGLTRTEMTFITDAPSMYTRFTPEILDDMAARGVWIVSQNSAAGAPYIRHQLTTAVSNGSLYYEDSAGTNIDAICFGIDDIVEPKIGKRNATPKTVSEIKNELIDFLNDLTEEAYDSVVGPQLAAFYNTAGDEGTIDVEIDANFKDRINVRVVLEIPLPLNNIRVVVLARTIRGDGGTAVNVVSTSILN